MSIDNSVLFENIKELVAEGGGLSTQYTYEAFIVFEEQRWPLAAVTKIDIERDYRTAYCDAIVMEAQVTGGIYSYHIYPNRNNMKVHLKRKSMLAQGVEPAKTFARESFVYDAVLIEASSPTLVDEGSFSDDESIADTTGLLTINLQLIESCIAPLRSLSANGIYRQVTVQEVIMALLRGRPYYDSSADLPDGIDMVACTNQQRYRALVIPESVELIEVPDYLQNTYGVYTGGLGFYLQDRQWYLYPVLRTDLLYDSRRSLSLIAMESTRMPGAETTYRLLGNQLMMIATGETVQENSTNALQLNRGNGVRYMDARRLLDHFSSHKNGKGFMDNTKNMVEYIGQPRKDNKVLAQYRKGGATTNHAHEASCLAMNSGNLLEVEWHNANPSMVLPGMPVRYLFRENKNVRSIQGCVLGCVHKSRALGKGMLQSTHYCHSVLRLLLEEEGAAP